MPAGLQAPGRLPLQSAAQTPQPPPAGTCLRISQVLVGLRGLAPRGAVVGKGREGGNLPNQPHHLLVLHLLALVDVLPRQRRVLRGVAGGRAGGRAGGNGVGKMVSIGAGWGLEPGSGARCPE